MAALFGKDPSCTHVVTGPFFAGNAVRRIVCMNPFCMTTLRFESVIDSTPVQFSCTPTEGDGPDVTYY